MKTLTRTILTLALLALLPACGVSTTEVDDRNATTELGDEEAGLSSAAAAGSRCARGQAYCAATRRCYPEACLSCCFAPSCGRGQAYCSFTNSCYPEACLSCCRPVQPSCGRGQAYCPSTNSCYPEACLSCCRLAQPSTDPDPNTDPAVCDAKLCGPAPAMPTIRCADGSLGGFTGRCLPRQEGGCGWEIRRCPSADDAR
ncbi:MAG: hypothetical protein JNJ54_16685 [Myxococcaceae bacterium]|nr:hypothetical protein [Myxococcaceae bacterium]